MLFRKIITGHSKNHSEHL